MRLSIFVSVVLITVALARGTGRHWLVPGLFLLLYPLTKNYVLHLRQGAAMALFYFGWSLPGYKGALLRWLSPFVHVSMWFVLAAEVWLRIAAWLRLSWGPRALFFFGFSTLLGVAVPLLATVSADRRLSVYQFSIPEISGFGALILAAIVVYILLFSDRSRAALMAVMGACFYLATLPFFEFGMRIFESFNGFLVLAVTAFRGMERLIYIGALSVYGALIWVKSSSGMPFLKALLSAWI
jgi:hypothetical protein